MCKVAKTNFVSHAPCMWLQTAISFPRNTNVNICLPSTPFGSCFGTRYSFQLFAKSVNILSLCVDKILRRCLYVCLFSENVMTWLRGMTLYEKKTSWIVALGINDPPRLWTFGPNVPTSLLKTFSRKINASRALISAKPC